MKIVELLNTLRDFCDYLKEQEIFDEDSEVSHYVKNVEELIDSFDEEDLE